MSGSEPTSQHPGKSDIDHLENPSASEEAVHSDKHAADPLKPHEKVGGSTPKTAWDNVKKTAEDVADKVKDATGLKVSFTTLSGASRSMTRRADLLNALQN